MKLRKGPKDGKTFPVDLFEYKGDGIFNGKLPNRHILYGANNFYLHNPKTCNKCLMVFSPSGPYSFESVADTYNTISGKIKLTIEWTS